MSTPTPGRLRDAALKNLLVGSVMTVVMTLGVPALLSVFGWAHAPTGRNWGILAAACFGIIAKLFASETATGEFEFYKLGYDFCTTALGGLITALALQLASSDDMFPGFSAIAFLPTFGRDAPDARTIQLVGCFLLTWLFVLLTARISRGVKEGNVDPRGGLASLSAVSGALLLCLYALVLSARG